MQQHTFPHVDCPACNALGHAKMSAAFWADLPFAEAAPQWLAGRRRLSPSSVDLNRRMLRELERFFGALRLREITVGHVIGYQKLRQEEVRLSRRHRARRLEGAADEESDGASRINHELSCLGQVMARAGLWAEIKRFYEPLPLPRPTSMALSPEEEEHLFRIARPRPRWFVAYCCGLVMRNTTATPGEVRHLRLGSLHLDGPEGSFVYVDEGVKNDFRKRPLPLNTDARWAIGQLLERAAGLGAIAPEHYLLPHRAHTRGLPADPTRPMGSWKRAHYAMCKAAAVRFPRLATFRPYDYRHTAATDMLENPGVSFTTIEHMMGHRLDSNVKRKYDHLRNTALAAAAAALDRKHTALAGLLQTPARLGPGRVAVEENAKTASMA